jgi:hypothetical protein
MGTTTREEAARARWQRERGGGTPRRRCASMAAIFHDVGGEAAMVKRRQALEATRRMVVRDALKR